MHTIFIINKRERKKLTTFIINDLCNFLSFKSLNIWTLLNFFSLFVLFVYEFNFALINFHQWSAQFRLNLCKIWSIVSCDYFYFRIVRMWYCNNLWPLWLVFFANRSRPRSRPSHRLAQSNPPSLPDNLHQRPFPSPAVKFPVKNLLPRPEIQPALGGCQYGPQRSKFSDGRKSCRLLKNVQ